MFVSGFTLSAIDTVRTPSFLLTVPWLGDVRSLEQRFCIQNVQISQIRLTSHGMRRGVRVAGRSQLGPPGGGAELVPGWVGSLVTFGA